MDTVPADVKAMMEQIKVLIVDDEYYTRKVLRTLLLAMGCTKIHEANDGASGLEAIRLLEPDVVLLDWEMPRIDGPEFVRRVRSPGTFPLPNVPIIMLTGHGERSRVLEAVRLGVHEFLLKPVSSSSLQGRIMSVLTKPRAMVKRGDYYGPEPRKLASYKPETDSYNLQPEAPRSDVGVRKSEASRPVDHRPAHMIFVN
ncbi:MAG: two-component system, chemotaxis family, chemotaxis protein CheY [Alphaproteobacteria bacterium]|nr:two-component system, chemotaxis family, chemotaxis protein CheY [Alphaproteobacteria bacterium]